MAWTGFLSWRGSYTFLESFSCWLSVLNYIEHLIVTASLTTTDFSPWGMVWVSWPISDGVSWNIYFQRTPTKQKLIQYFIAFSDYVSHIWTPKQKILLPKRIHGRRNLSICKSYYKSPSMEFFMWANLPRYVGQLTPMRGKLVRVYLPHKSRNSVKIMGVLYALLGRNKAEV